MSSAAYELGYLKAGVELLDSYLQSNDLYWAIAASPPPGEPAYRQLTLGGLLLNEQRLQARSLPRDMEIPCQETVTRLKEAISHRPVAWERKASREFGSRLKMWGNFLNEYREDPENHADRYAFEVERRVMLQLLEPYARDAHPAEHELLSSLDGMLKAVLVPGEFIWDAAVIGAFRKELFWYLYGKLRK